MRATRRHVLQLSSISALAITPALALAQDASGAKPRTFAQFCHDFWAAAALATRIGLGVASFGIIVWLLGAVVLGYLFFHANVEAMAAVRWGYFAGVLIWAVAAVIFGMLIGAALLPLALIVLAVVIIPSLIVGRARRTA